MPIISCICHYITSKADSLSRLIFERSHAFPLVVRHGTVTFGRVSVIYTVCGCFVLNLARELYKELIFAMLGRPRRRRIPRFGITLPLEPSPKWRNVHEIDCYQDDHDGEAACRQPEHPLRQSHVTNVRGVHAEDACDK
jgi:hypothetical protein